MNEQVERAIAEYEPVIGLEVHAQLLTESKAFCGCSTEFGKEPNYNVCPVCLGMPGTLPVLNIKLVDYVIRMGLATGCRIASRSIFARKNYFYPDLPKGYQISQYEDPICAGGHVDIELPDGPPKRIGITRIHMEEDAGKSIHDRAAETLIDVNRCGVPLIEIVSEPDIRSAQEAYLYLTRLKQLLTYLGICDGNMEEGSLRCDANVSVRKKGETSLGTKTEVKNMNSFRNVDRALHYEIARQIELLRNGESVVQQTLLWDADAGIVHPMRSKEEAHDYRYFPDPDLVPVTVDEAWISRVQSELPELPAARRDRFIRSYHLPKYDAEVLTADRSLADYFEGVIVSLEKPDETGYKSISNLVMGEVLRTLKERSIPIERFPIPPGHVGQLVNLIRDDVISGSIGKQVFEMMLDDPRTPIELVKERNLVQVTDASSLEPIVLQVLGDHPDEVKEYRNGRTKLLGFFMGRVMKLTEGKANPKLVNELVLKALNDVEKR